MANESAPGGSSRSIGALIVDDQPDIRTLLRVFIEAENEGLYVAAEAADGVEALAVMDQADPAVVILDHMMPGLSGLETASLIRKRRPDQRIILFSAFLTEDVRRQAEEIGITMCIAKNHLESVASAVRRIASSMA